MNQIRFNYSLKNIGLPTRDEYKKKLVDKIENVVSRMRWKAHFYLNDPNAKEQYKFGLKSTKSPSIIHEMKAFEDDLAHMMENIQFRNVSNPFLNEMDNDLKKIKSSPNIFVFADKTRNIYETSAENYNKILKENVTKSYKVSTNDVLEDINSDLSEIANDLSVSDRIETMAPKNAFVTVKDHKENFKTNPKFRLINPAKSELGKISKITLDIRKRTKVNQWKNSLSVIDWFNNIKNKPRHSFLIFDIAEFYPSITEELLDKAIAWAQNYVTISEQQIEIIKHARNSLLFSNGKTWIKQQDNPLFDVTMGSNDGAEVCELVGLFILNSLAKKYGKERVGLYRDDGLILLSGTSARLADKARKYLHELFGEFQLKITAEITHQSVNFLDVTFNLRDESYQPYRKPNNDPLFIDSRSNHPPAITKQLPTSVNMRISQLSSNQEAFSKTAPL